MTALAPAALVRRLLDEGLLTPADVVDAGVTLSDASRSHAVTLVRRGAGGGLVVKQADPARSGPDRTLAREAAVHALASTIPQLAAAAPRVHRAGDELVITDLVEGADTFWVRTARERSLHPDLATALGRTLGELHAATRGVDGLPGAAPWVLSSLDPGAWTASDPRTAPVLGLVPRPDATRAALAAAGADWRPVCLVHGDVRWENVLADGDRALLVDWELADRGDPLWDVAGALAEVMAGPIVGTTSVRSMPLAARRLWSGWRTAFRPDGTPAARRRAVTLAGARLLQLAFEHAHRAGVQSPAVAPLAQRATHVLTDPEAAGCTLFNDRPP